MSLYADYLKERSDDAILENDFGFVVYRFVEDGKAVYLVDIYIVPQYRKTGHGKGMAGLVAQLAKDVGCTSMIGTVKPSAKGSTISLKVLLAYGMHLERSGDDFIIMRKEI